MSSLSERVDRGGKLALSHSIYVALYYGIMVQAKVVGGNSQTGNSRGRESMGIELELELIQTQMAQKPMLRAEVGMRVRCANKASAE